MKEANRYSDPELELFRIHIEQMIEKEKINLQFIVTQIKEMGENNGNDGDWMDDSSLTTDKEMLYTMESRQRRHLWDLENALLRIKNKTYGVCIITGEKIDKRRLMAVPTTAKCLAAKGAPLAPLEKKDRTEVLGSAATKRKEILSRVAANVTVAIPSAASNKMETTDEEEEDMDEDYYEEEGNESIDLDELVDEDTED